MENWTTDRLPPHRQYKAWCERLQEGCNPALAVRNEADDAPFPARVRIAKVGSCDMLTVQAPPHWMELRSREAAGGGNYFALFLFSPARLGTARNRIEAPAHSIVMVDPNRDESLESTAGVSYGSIRIPRHMLDAHIPAHRWPHHVLPLRTRDAAGALVSNYVGTLLQNGGEFASHNADTITDTLCRLLALAIKDGNPDRADDQLSVRAARLARAKRAINARLADADLSPASLAASLGMSSRNLHLLFQDTGETFAQYVMARRLEACRTALTDPLQAARSVTDIAFAWGFSNLATFYRAFKAAYDMTPKEMRAWSDAGARAEAAGAAD